MRELNPLLTCAFKPYRHLAHRVALVGVVGEAYIR